MSGTVPTGFVEKIDAQVLELVPTMRSYRSTNFTNCVGTGFLSNFLFLFTATSNVGTTDMVFFYVLHYKHWKGYIYYLMRPQLASPGNAGKLSCWSSTSILTLRLSGNHNSRLEAPTATRYLSFHLSSEVSSEVSSGCDPRKITTFLRPYERYVLQNASDGWKLNPNKLDRWRVSGFGGWSDFGKHSQTLGKYLNKLSNVNATLYRKNVRTVRPW